MSEETDQASPSDEAPPQKEKHSLRYRPRKSPVEPTSWFRGYGPEIFLLLGVIITVALFANPFPLISGLLFRINQRIAQWLVSGEGSLFLAVILTLSLVFAITWRIHWRIVHTRRWWDRECPQCHTADLRRMHRTRLALWLNRLFIPARSYSCPHCHWQGIRIDETKV